MRLGAHTRDGSESGSGSEDAEREHRVGKEKMLPEVNRLAMWFSKPVEYSFIWPLRGGSYLSVRIYYDVAVRYACAASGDWASNV